LYDKTPVPPPATTVRFVQPFTSKAAKVAEKLEIDGWGFTLRARVALVPLPVESVT
jgi:hypothetical protein